MRGEATEDCRLPNKGQKPSAPPGLSQIPPLTSLSTSSYLSKGTDASFFSGRLEPKTEIHTRQALRVSSAPPCDPSVRSLSGHTRPMLAQHPNHDTTWTLPRRCENPGGIGCKTAGN